MHETRSLFGMSVFALLVRISADRRDLRAAVRRRRTFRSRTDRRLRVLESDLIAGLSGYPLGFEQAGTARGSLLPQDVPAGTFRAIAWRNS